jgi:Domain of Unknown Function (DUF1259)
VTLYAKTKEVDMNVRPLSGPWVLTATVLLLGCGGAPRPAVSPPPAPPIASSAPAAVAAPQAEGIVPTPPAGSPPPATGAAKGPLDAARIAAATGGKPETIDNVVKVSFPRDDVKVEVDGWSKMPPFMGLTSYAGFVPAEKPGAEAMVMGDLVLFEDEVNAAMSAALDNGLEVTALHNHFFFDKPHVLFMHIGGEGTVDQLGKGLRAALDAARGVRQKTPKPTAAFGPPPPAPSKIDAGKMDAVFGVKGAAKDGLYKGTFGRKTQAECGCTVGKAMGVATWAAFAGSDDNAVVDGDFAVAESELQPVLKSLRTGGINVVSIHSHMTNESPRLVFLHYWGRGRAADLANVVKRTLDMTAWDGHPQA